MATTTGRPSIISQTVRVREDGTEVTAAQHLIERINLLGDDHVVACASAGIAVATFHKWRLAGGRALGKLARGEELTGDEPAYAEFVEELERAEANAELRRVTIVEQGSQPHKVVKVTERRDAAGNLLEQTTVTESRPGAWQAAAWWLERRRPEKYGRKYELSGPGGGPIPIEDRARSLGEDLAAFQAGAAAQAEATEAAP